jgi:hypothetical protein
MPQLKSNEANVNMAMQAIIVDQFRSNRSAAAAFGLVVDYVILVPSANSFASTSILVLRTQRNIIDSAGRPAATYQHD